MRLFPIDIPPFGRTVDTTEGIAPHGKLCCSATDVWAWRPSCDCLCSCDVALISSPTHLAVPMGAPYRLFPLAHCALAPARGLELTVRLFLAYASTCCALVTCAPRERLLP